MRSFTTQEELVLVTESYCTVPCPHIPNFARFLKLPTPKTRVTSFAAHWCSDANLRASTEAVSARQAVPKTLRAKSAFSFYAVGAFSGKAPKPS